MFITAEGLFHVKSFSFAACSEPLGLTFTDVGETTLALEWSESAIPNGIIDNYTVREYLILVKIISQIIYVTALRNFSVAFSHTIYKL